jgi:nucleoside-diphosphate-sugar epimerase
MQLSITGVTGDVGGGYLDSIDGDNTVKTLVRKGSHVSRRGIRPFFFTDGFNYQSTLLEEFVEGGVLVHCATLLNSDQYDLVEVIAINALLTGALVTSAVRMDVPKIVYISTEMVYDLEDSTELSVLCTRFLQFCQQHFSGNEEAYDLEESAKVFIDQNSGFPFEEYDNYSLTKYLGEAIVKNISNVAILRVSNAYGPGYSNPRLMPRMIQGRLIGHDVTYPSEQRDFVFSEDISRLIDEVIQQDLAGVIDCRSGEKIRTNDLADMIVCATPTAYGELLEKPTQQKHKPQKSILAANSTLASVIDPTSFADGFTATLRWHKEQTYHQMKDGRSLQDFLEPDEYVVKMLKGSSAAHLCVVAGSDKVYKVRKIAIYDGVEGNGIAKVANEIKYYQYIAKHKPKLAAMYPRLINAKTDETFSSETIEYLSGRNFYQAIKDGDLPTGIYRESLIRFIDNLSSCALKDCRSAGDSGNNLDAYYVERSLSRLNPISEVLTIQDELKINGKRYTAPEIILSDLLRNEKLRELVKPRTEIFCSHGDLTFLNTVFVDETQEIRLIDPRGFIGNWDPLYDYAKLQFTLCGFGEFVVDKKPMVTKKGDGDFTINFNQIPEVSRQLHDEFLDLLGVNPTFKKEIIKHEPRWRERIAFAKATHFLADIPFRLFTDSTTDTALASYVIGTYYLNEVYEALKK